ncbi:MAG: DedA family protein [Enterobacterales bacterium]|jgi:membrane protein DedA with SNARE-associated domain|uniref:Membrane protein n=1 Tax=Hafnia alvei FB1 TaxID=1453496 RepID=A0A097R1C2_HAFAL|nr:MULTISPECIES: DedA family protein [Hafnia]MDN6089352.1 DedA family protein [Enterobacterales bacterium]AIU72534.1 membrane protein [Hafnia alvei FB1]KID00323.2 membrane protein [Hafnia alvei]KKI42869.1 membrane protein [Hafnia alvei]MBW3478195.1 DedA family protein [Hafnia alvei]
MTDAGQWISDYGYVAVVLGSIIEGETIAFLAGAAAHKHLLSYPLVLLMTFLGATAGDFTLYLVGRRFGRQILARFKRQQKKIQRFQQRVREHETLLILGMRFAYGFRTIGPIIIGSSGVKLRKFVLLNIIGAAIWAFIIVTLGYAASEVLFRLFAHEHQRRIAFVVLMVALLVGLIGVKWYRSKQSDKDE